jgi:hypothetical protein
MSLRLRLEPRLGNVLEVNRLKAAISHIVSALFENELVVRCIAGCLVAVRWCAETRRTINYADVRTHGRHRFGVVQRLVSS